MNKLVDEFYNYLKYQKNYSDYTVDNYVRDINEYIEFLESNKFKYDYVDYDICIKYLNFLSCKKLSKSSISRKLSSIRTFYKYLVLNEKVNTNPFILVSSPKKEKRIPKFINYKNIDELFNVIDLKTEEGQRQKVILDVLYSCGIRVSELVNIKLKDIDFNDRTILIFGKGSKERIVRFGEMAFDSLNLYINDGRNKLLKEIKSDYLIVGEKKEKLTTRRIQQIVDDLVNKTSIKLNITPHMFRHTFATHLLDNGCELLAVQELLGHESLTSTEVYTHVSNEHLRDVFVKCHPRNIK